MTDTGNDCPECGRRLHGAKCPCGWSASTDAETSCKACKKEREDRTGTFFCIERCLRCGVHDRGVKAFFADDPDAKPEDRGKRLCASCWIPALKRLATCAHAWTQGLRDGEKCATCEADVADQRQQFREAMAKIEERNVTL